MRNGGEELCLHVVNLIDDVVGVEVHGFERMPPLAGLTQFLQVVCEREEPLLGFAVINAVTVRDVFLYDGREAL